MATDEQVKRFLEIMSQTHPTDFFLQLEEIHVGIGAVLCLLVNSENEVTAGTISDELKISTARVAVLLKKMAAKGLIEKERGRDDSRVTIVKLTDYGRKTIEEMHEGLYKCMSRIIDEVGEERLREFFSTAEDIKNAVSLQSTEY